jgi:hypothetical protein
MSKKTKITIENKRPLESLIKWELKVLKNIKDKNISKQQD